MGAVMRTTTNSALVVMAMAMALAATACSTEAARSPGGFEGAGTGAPPAADPGAPAGAGGTGAGSPPPSTGGGGGIIGTGAAPGSTPGAGGRQGCASSSIQSEFLPANILFVVDRSGSMNCNLPALQGSGDCEQNPEPVDPSQPTKWGVITSTLEDAMAGLPAGAWAGINYFSNDSICGVQSAPTVPIQFLDQPHLDTLSQSLRTITPRGGTPIIGATVLGFKHLHQQALLPLQSNSFLVMLTDGSDTCDPDQAGRLIDVEIPNARAVGIRTFAIGVPGSENGRALLSSMAWAGGTAVSDSCDHSASARDVGDCHFDMTQSNDLAADLSNALAQISGKTISCELDVPEAPDGASVDPRLVNVDYFPAGGTELESIPQDTTADCDAGADGWQYADGDRKIKLCGASCDRIKADTSARVEIVLGCETIVR